MLTVPDAVQAWWHAQGVSAVESLSPERVIALDECCDAASKWIRNVTGCDLESGSHTEYFDGDGQDELFLHPGRLNIQYPTGFSVTEDGTSLTIAAGYSTTAGVIIAGHTEPEGYVRLIRNSCSWSTGIQNLKVIYTSGWNGADHASPTIPSDYQQLANEVALLMFLSPNWIGKSSMVREGVSHTWEKDLTPQSKELIRRLMSRTR